MTKVIVTIKHRNKKRPSAPPDMEIAVQTVYRGKKSDVELRIGGYFSVVAKKLTECIMANEGADVITSLNVPQGFPVADLSKQLGKAHAEKIRRVDRGQRL